MSITTSTQAFAMWDALVAVMAAEKHAGGRLATLADIRQSAQFSTTATPALAIQMKSWDPGSEPAYLRTNKVAVEFELILAARSVAAGAPTNRMANLDDVWTTLRPLLDDGNGNGIIPILNDRATFGLLKAEESRIGKGEMLHQINDGAQQSVWGYIVQPYTAMIHVSF